jgi:serine/threonine-protein kinase
MIGQLVGSYRIQSKLGEGGMGIVWAAEHAALGRRVALKMLLPELSANRDIVSRFFAEARTAASIEHPGMVDVYDFGHHGDGCAYIVMEFLEGETLTRYLARAGGRLPPEMIRTLGRQIASAVGAAHQKGIVHRDLKPDNVYLVADAEIAIGMRAKVLDFGIAKLMADGKAGTLRTRTGVIMGTPIYMSPEQCRGAGRVDARADIYSLGCILYQLACGQPPFFAEGMGEVIAAHLYGQPEPLSLHVPGIPAELEAIILRCLAKAPKDRPQSMEELMVGLGGAYASHPPVGPKSYPLISVRTHHGTFVGGARRALIVAGIATVGIGSAVALIVAQRGGPATPTSATVAGAEPAAKPPQAPPAPVPPPPQQPVPTRSAEAPTPVVVPMTAPAPTHVTLKVTSEPSGAEVFRAADGIKLGVTPLELPMERTIGVAVFILKLAGHEDGRAELSAEQNGAVAVTLKRTAALPAARATRPPRPATGPAPAAAPPGEKKTINDGTLDPFAR